MAELQQNDVNVVISRLANGRRHMKLVHTPTGLSADGYVTEEPSYRLKDKLMQELRQRVASHHLEKGDLEDQPDRDCRQPG